MEGWKGVARASSSAYHLGVQLLAAARPVAPAPSPPAPPGPHALTCSTGADDGEGRGAGTRGEENWGDLKKRTQTENV